MPVNASPSWLCKTLLPSLSHKFTYSTRMSWLIRALWFSMGDIFKASTHEGACSRSTLLQHATGAKLPRSHQRFLAKNMLCNKTFAPEFCSLISNWFDMREQAPGANLLDESVSGASSLVCTEICLLWNDVSPVGQSIKLAYFSKPELFAAMLDLKQLVPMPQSGCFIIQLPHHVLRVYWLGYLPGSAFQEQAPWCVPTLSTIHLYFLSLTPFGRDK